MAEEDKEKQNNEAYLPGNSDGGIKHVSGMYRNWFLDYASYVILERAVPVLEDGLKPVHRRILHSMREMEDGRYNKVANIIGNTMKYHPHGDASIGDALVQLGQKDLLIDMQGNWGNILTGDSAAAPRYIEARLSKFALDVVFNPKTTNWQLSYDGRNKEPITLPVKFPLLLAQGAEGIAVGLACKMLPHNFNELIDASIAYLKGKSFKILPDFPSAGMADFSQYNEGLRGGRIRVRGKINQLDKKTLEISEIPFGTTTSSLIESIIRANDKGKIKIKKVEDNTSDRVEILVHLTPGVSPDKMIDALYAFTDCEVSISPNSCVIENDKPRFVGVSDMLRESTDHTVELLKKELEIRKSELEEQWHFLSLEKVFIEKRIYRDIEECETWESIIDTIRKGLKPHIKHLIREVTDEDIGRLTEIKIKRISKFDSDKADDKILNLESEIDKVKFHLDNLVDYAIDYFKRLKEKYGKGRERKTEIKSFESIEAAKVAVANVKLYVNKEEGFAGFGLKRTESEFVCDCSDIDDVIVIRSNGKMLVSKITNKAFFGKDILHVGIWKKGDERTIYNMIYQDGPRGNVMMKRFAVKSVTRDKEYDLTAGTKNSKVLYLTANPNGEAEVLGIHLRPKPKLRKLKFELDFSELDIRGRNAKGNILTKHTVSKIIQKEKGISTLGARKIWFDDTVQRLNSDGRGEYLGEFSGEDKILTITQTGNYKLTGFDLNTHFEEDLIIIEKWNPEKPITAVYFDGKKKKHFVKRFLVEDSDKLVKFITEHDESWLEIAFTEQKPSINIQYDKRSNDREDEKVDLAEFISVKGLKAKGNQLTSFKVKNIDALPSVEAENKGDEEKSLEKVVEDDGPAENKSEKPEAKGKVPVEDKKEPTAESKKESNKDNGAPSSNGPVKNGRKSSPVKPINDEDNQIKLDLD